MIRTRRTTVGRDLERLLRDGVRPAQGDAYLLDRYLGGRDEAAFEILVGRHGPMVLSLCRRYLRDPRDVEDAFQATFLVLARKGPGLRDKSSLSSWLYGVAYRVAMRARSDVLKRRAREVQSDAIFQAPARPTDPPDDSAETLDAELSRLPEKYRAPLVLCHLEGRTHEQAAAELGWPVGTVRSRMARARSILEARLARRGLDASACLAFLRPDHLITSTVLPTLTMASTSWPATALAQGVLATMLISQLKWIGVATAAFGLVAATAGIGAWAVNAPDENQDAPRSTATKQGADRPNPAPPSVRSIVKAEPQPSADLPDVQSRLTEIERKMDRLMELLERMGERSGTHVIGIDMKDHRPVAPGGPDADGARRDMTRPASSSADVLSPVQLPDAPPRADAAPTGLPEGPGGPAQLPPRATPGVEAGPATSTVEVRTSTIPPSTPLPPGEASPDVLTQYVASDRDRGGLREIQAQLLNLHERYKRKKASHDTGAISDEEYFVPIELARILVARLQEMDDDLETEQSRSEAEVREATNELADFRDRVERAKEIVKESSLEKLKRQTTEKDQIAAVAVMNAKNLIDRSDQSLDSSTKKIARMDRGLELLHNKRARIGRAIDWAARNFDGLKLDDLP